jgi:hypothetical protein
MATKEKIIKTVIKGAVEDAAEGAAKDAAEDAAKDAAEDAAKDAAKDAAEDATEDAAKDAADDAAKGAAKDAAGDAAKGIKPFDWLKGAASGGAELCTDNPRTCAALVAGTGVAAYVAEKNAKASKEEQACKSVCLPSNWNDYIGDPDNTAIKYRAVPVLDKDGNPTGFPADEVCKSPEKDCDKFCDRACHISRSLLGDVPFLGNVTDTIEDLFNQFFGKFGKYVSYFLYFCIVAFIIFLIFNLFKKN